jgi:hypothetical protein
LQGLTASQLTFESQVAAVLSGRKRICEKRDLSRFSLFPNLLEQIMAFFWSLLESNECELAKQFVAQNELLRPEVQGLISAQVVSQFRWTGGHFGG